MKEEWFSRLIEAIERDPRSKREISLAAKCGENYVQQMVRDRKAPGIDRLGRLCEVLGDGAALYVITGVEATEDDLRFLSALRLIPRDAREQAVQFFEALASNSSPGRDETDPARSKS